MRGHPVFDNEHIAGNHSTAHRPPEQGRLQASEEGEHQKGQFEMKVPSSHEEWKQVAEGKRFYDSPSGVCVAVEHHDSSEPRAEHDQEVSVNGKRMFKGAAKTYLNDRHGIQI